MPSKAYVVFLKNLEQINRLGQTYDNELRMNSGRGKKKLDHITRSGVVFLCSSFEIYFEMVLKESCVILSKASVTPNDLPKQVKKNNI